MQAYCLQEIPPDSPKVSGAPLGGGGRECLAVEVALCLFAGVCLSSGHPHPWPRPIPVLVQGPHAPSIHDAPGSVLIQVCAQRVSCHARPAQPLQARFPWATLPSLCLLSAACGRAATAVGPLPDAPWVSVCLCAGRRVCLSVSPSVCG